MMDRMGPGVCHSRDSSSHPTNVSRFYYSYKTIYHQVYVLIPIYVHFPSPSQTNVSIGLSRPHNSLSNLSNDNTNRNINQPPSNMCRWHNCHPSRRRSHFSLSIRTNRILYLSQHSQLQKNVMAD
jgi:hypothetical protein